MNNGTDQIYQLMARRHQHGATLDDDFLVQNRRSLIDTSRVFCRVRTQRRDRQRLVRLRRGERPQGSGAPKAPQWAKVTSYLRSFLR